jgi:hypothetical protein
LNFSGNYFTSTSEKRDSNLDREGLDQQLIILGAKESSDIADILDKIIFGVKSRQSSAEQQAKSTIALLSKDQATMRA